MSTDSRHRHDHGSDHHEAMIADFRRRLWVSLLLTLPILVLSPPIQRWISSSAGIDLTLQFAHDGLARLGLATVLFAYGGWPFLRGLVDELGERRPAMMTLIALALSVAYTYSAAVVFGLDGRTLFWELATLIDVMLLGHWIEMRSIQNASGAVEELAALLPARALRVQEDGSTEEVAIDALESGDRVLVKPGARIPADGTIEEGRSRIDVSMLTGETEPEDLGEGDEVMGGAVNGGSTLTIRVDRTGDDSFVSEVIGLVHDAQESHSRYEQLGDRAARWLTYVALGAGGMTLLVWMGVGRGLDFALARMVTVMVITCPHALGLAIPLVTAVSTSLSAQHGLLVRDRSAFERARELDAIVFDKTGTLTHGRFAVEEVVAWDDRTEDQLLSLAAALETGSEHPIGAGIVAAAEERGIDLAGAESVEAIPGRGVRGRVEQREIGVVSRGYLEENSIEVDDAALESSRAAGNTIVFVLDGSRSIGAIALADQVREESIEAMQRLHARGITLMMMTGDSEAVARSVADRLDLDDYVAEVLPDAKADEIRAMQDRSLRVAMVGDGVNDAPALAAADLGIAVGAGTDVAIESADLVLVRSDPRDVATVLELAHATHRKTVQNLLWATGYNVVAIPLAAGVLAGLGILLSPAVGAVLMSVSTVVVALNAKLLQRFEPGAV